MALPQITTDRFRSEVLESDVPVVVDFFADWCGPCHSIAPMIERLAQEWADELKVVKVDTEAEPEVAAAYRISSIPAILLFQDGEVKGWSLGVKPGHVIERELGLKRRRSPASGPAGGPLASLKAWWRST